VKATISQLKNKVNIVVDYWEEMYISTHFLRRTVCRCAVNFNARLSL